MKTAMKLKKKISKKTEKHTNSTISDIFLTLQGAKKVNKSYIV